MAGPGFIPGGLGGIPPGLLSPEVLAPLPPPAPDPGAAPPPVDAFGGLQPGIGIPAAALDAAAPPPPDLGLPPDHPLAAGLAPLVPLAPPGAAPWRPYGLDPGSLPLPPFDGAIPGQPGAEPWFATGAGDQLGPLPPGAGAAPLPPELGAPGGPLPDAITGQVERSLTGPPDQPFGAPTRGPGQLPEQQYQRLALNYQRNPDQLLSDVINGPPSADKQRYLDELALRDQPGFAELSQRVADARDKMIEARKVEIQNRYYDQQMANARIRDDAMKATQTKIDQVLADAQRISATKIDPTGGLSGGQKIAGVLASVIGGLVQGRTGSPNNAGLDALNQTINRAVEAQKADLANQRAGLDFRRMSIGDQVRMDNENYLAAETVRLASLQHAEDQLKTMQQDFAPDGVRGLRIAGLRAGIVAGQAATVRDIAHKTLEDELKIRKSDQESTLALETLRHNRATEGLEYAKLSLEKAKEKAKAGDDTLLTPQEIQQQFPSLPTAAIPPIAMTRKQLGQHLENFNKSLETANKTVGNTTQVAGTQAIGPDGKPLTRDGTPTGAPVVFATHELAAKVNESVAGAQDMLDSLGSVRRFLASDPSAVNRKAWADAKTEIENAKFAYAKLHDTKASSRELEAMTDLFGPNPESYISRVKDKGVMLAHIDTLTRDAKNTIAHKLKQQGQYTGPSVLVDTSQLPTSLSDAAALSGRTAIEVGQDAKLGAVRQLLQPKPYGDPALINELHPGFHTDTGLDPADDAKVREAIARAAGAPPAERADAVAKIAAWAASPRASIASGVLGLVRGESPALYDEVVALLPAKQRETLPDWKNLGLPGADFPLPSQLPRPPIDAGPPLPIDYGLAGAPSGPGWGEGE